MAEDVVKKANTLQGVEQRTQATVSINLLERSTVCPINTYSNQITGYPDSVH